ncbi:GLPGLI family protein [Kaistella flava (ex Peng et al. 2021)]|uniref:GLPGLI family protein n=1 Tax=Kaistella flava (ex Peng et al. 2021) TaxID=2038776 RepID=A0A7M2YBU9_9FLAO|nr:GLPGLI family protein [Kaistella flava (ex Peng et al. 2021)]QOW11084.1 GLPGLI family protein [Kaistella flava (ex Peng et al. 2021)]
MKKTTLLLLFFGLIVSAQNNRMIYEYKFRPDSTKIDSLKTEWIYLDINKNGSKYYSKKAFENDSIVNESIKKQMASGMRSISVSRQQSGSDISYEVEKTYPEYKTFLVSNIGNDSYKVLEDRKPNWKILSDKKQIGEFKVQKATANFAGRNWEAWFTTDVPIQDGPYKFSGLPGLIVEIADQTGSHKIELKGIKKIVEVQKEELNTEGKNIPYTKKKPLEVNRQQYVKQLKQYENDPVQGMREILSRPNSKVMINVNGKEISDPKDILRELEKNAKEEMVKNNNKIELIP